MPTTPVHDALNGLLADATVFYQKLRAFHWLVHGRQFFGLHAKFEEMYDAWADHIDDIAERILTVGGTPLASLSEMLSRAQIKEYSAQNADKDMVSAVQTDLEHFVATGRQVIETAEAAGDRGTANLIDGLLDEQEKTLWMLRAWAS